MMYTDSSYSFEQPVTYTTLTTVVDVRGDSRRTIIDENAVQVGIGRKSWDQLEGWMGERGIRSTMTGPLYTSWRSFAQRDYGADLYEIVISFTAVAMIVFDEAEDEVRWGREVASYCGAPELYTNRRIIPQPDATIQNYFKSDLCRWVRDAVGGLPGESRTVRTPVSVLN